MLHKSALWSKFLARPAWTLSLAFILLLAAGLRLYALDTYPQRFNQDEMAQGYNGWSLWQTGRDYWGYFLPVFFRNFGDWVPPLANYVTAPFVGILGLSEFSTRLPVALFGIAMVWLVALLGRRWFGWQTGLLAALFLATEPWHLNYSRIAFQASYVPFFTTAALYAFTRAIQSLTAPVQSVSNNTAEDSAGLFGVAKINTRQAGWWLVLSGFLFALLTATYPTMKLQTPLLMGACLIATPLLWQRQNWRLTIVWSGTFLVAVSPLMIAQLTNWEAVQSRYTQNSIFQEDGWIFKIPAQYLNHYNPLNLFFRGFQEGVGVRPAQVGELFWLEGFLWLVAAFDLFWPGRWAAHKGFNLPLLVAIWLLTWPIAASLTLLEHTHEIRSYNFLPLPELLAGYGAVVGWRELKRFACGWRYTLAIGGLIIFGGFNWLFLSYFFGPPLLQTNIPAADLPYNIGLSQALAKMQPYRGPCDQLWLDSDNQGYVSYLFLTHYPPTNFQQYSLAQNYFVDRAISFDNVYFVQPDDPRVAPGGATPKCRGKDKRVIWVTRQPLPTQTESWQTLAQTYNTRGLPVWYILMANIR